MKTGLGSAGVAVLLILGTECFAQNVGAMRESCEKIYELSKATTTSTQQVYVDGCVAFMTAAFNQQVQELASGNRGAYKKDVATCVLQAFQTMGFSAPGFEGVPCNAYAKVKGVQTVDSREITGGVEVLAEVTVEGMGELARGSMIGGACGFPVDLQRGTVFRMPARLLFEKWSSGLRCISRTWQ